MSKKKEKKVKSAPSPVRRIERPKSFSIFFVVRLLLAVLVTVAALASIRFTWRTLMADNLGQTGFLTANNPQLRRVGLPKLKAALNEAPFDPITQYRIGDITVQIESQKLIAQDYTKVNVNDLVEARELLMEARKGRYKPQEADLRLAHTEALMAEYYRQTNSLDNMRLMSNEAAKHFVTYQRLQGISQQKPNVHYRTAMEHSMVEPFPHLALEHYDDIIYFHGQDAIEEPKIEMLAADARVYLGEFHLMMLNLLALVQMDPQNDSYLAKFENYATLSKQQKLGADLLETLDLNGADKEKVDQLVQRLRG